MSVADDICRPQKGWLSKGAVHHDPANRKKPAYYSKPGMVFKATQTTRTVLPKKIRKLKFDEVRGAYIEEFPEARGYNRKEVIFTIEQSGMLPKDPITNEEFLPFPEDFVQLFKSIPFYEIKPDLLVMSQPIFVPELNLAVSYTVEIYEHNGEQSMLQRAFWSDGYQGLYCCDKKED